MSKPPALSAEQLRLGLLRYIDQEVERFGTTEAVKPAHRVPFHWPPEAISYKYHVLASDWTEHANYSCMGELFPARVAHTQYGYFGRCEKLWHEARGATLEEMLKNLSEGAKPLLERQYAIARCLGAEKRYVGYVRDLAPADLLKLLYCDVRDVTHEARVEIEKHASLRVFGPALIEVLKDTRHPYRRSAQWAVLDMFEDLPSVCRAEEEQLAAIKAMRDLIFNAPDDYARTVYKAGVVLGGHLPHEHGGPILLECLSSPSKYGRRAAIHGLFHVVEWHPSMMPEVVERLKRHIGEETDPILAEYTRCMARDIEAGRDHVPDPFFPEEAN